MTDGLANGNRLNRSKRQSKKEQKKPFWNIWAVFKIELDQPRKKYAGMLINAFKTKTKWKLKTSKMKDFTKNK